MESWKSNSPLHLSLYRKLLRISYTIKNLPGKIKLTRVVFYQLADRARRESFEGETLSYKISYFFSILLFSI